LLLCLGRCFTLKKIRQPLLCFVEWIKAKVIVIIKES